MMDMRSSSYWSGIVEKPTVCILPENKSMATKFLPVPASMYQNLVHLRKQFIAKVEFEEVNSDKLSADVSVRLLNEIGLWNKFNPRSFIDHRPISNRSHRQNGFYLPKQMYVMPTTVLNPPNGSCIFVNKQNKFHIILESTGARGSNHKVWDIFSAWGIRTLSPISRYKQGKKVIQQFSVELDWPKADEAFIQFATGETGIKYGARKTNGLLTFFLFKNLRVCKERVHPLLVSVVPREDVTIVPMLPGQILEIITPTSHQVTLDKKSNYLTHMGDCICNAGDGALKCTFIKCVSFLQRHEPIFVNSDNTDRCINVPILETRDKKLFASIMSPSKTFRLYSYNIAGFSIKSVLNKSWHTYDPFANVKKVSSDMKETLYTFTKSEPSYCFTKDSHTWSVRS